MDGFWHPPKEAHLSAAFAFLRPPRAAVACTLVASALFAALAPGVDASTPAQWVEARSPHFVVISNGGGEQARRVSLAFERARTMLRRALTGIRLEPRRPVVVLAVKNKDSLKELLPQFWDGRGQRPVAAYWDGPHRHDIVLRVDTPDRELYRRAFHEYVHLLTHTNFPEIPAWLNEGLAELWSTAVVQDNAVEVGRAARRHVKVLRRTRRWIPLHELLTMARAPDPRDARKLSLFYAESWALTHYGMLRGSSTALELAPSEYVEQLRERGDPVEAATYTFGNLAELERVLAAYVRTGRFRVVRIEVRRQDIESTAQKGSAGLRIRARSPGALESTGHNGNAVAPVRSPSTGLGPSAPDENTELRVRALSPAESLAVRAGFLADGERPTAALPLLTRALGLDPNEPSVLEALGYFHFRENHPAEAAGWLDRAIASGRASYLAYFYRAILAGPVPGRVCCGAALDAVGHGQTAELVSAEAYLRRAIDLNPEFAPAYARLADLYAEAANSEQDPLPLMRRAAELESDNTTYWLNLAKLLVRANCFEEAREAGQRALALARSAGSRELAEALLRDIDRGPQGR